MANVCNQEVSVSGNTEQVKALFDLVGKDFDFNKVIPINDEEGSGDGMAYWGCTSIAFDVKYHEQSEDYREWYFWTKWNPPAKIFHKLYEMFDDIIISWEYDEPGCGLHGNLNEDSE